MEIKENIFWFSFLILVVISFLGFIIPLLTKDTILFGSRIPQELKKHDEVKQLKKNFKQVYLIIEIPFLIIAGIFLYNFSSNIYFAIGIYFQIILMFVIYVSYNRKAKELKKILLKGEDIVFEKQIRVVDTKIRDGKNLISIWWFLPALIIVAANYFTLLISYNNIPQIIVKHFNLNGEAVQFMSKSYLHVFSIPLTATIVFLIFIFIYFSIKRSKQEIDSRLPETSKIRNSFFKLIWSYYLVIVVTVLTVWMFLLSLHSVKLFSIQDGVFKVLTLAIPISILFGTIILAIKIGQSGSRLKVKVDEEEQPMNNVDDDRFWKWGMFYFNPSDPSFFVEKRFGIGWTLNFGKPVSIILVAALIVFIIIKIITH